MASRRQCFGIFWGCDGGDAHTPLQNRRQVWMRLVKAHDKFSDFNRSSDSGSSDVMAVATLSQRLVAAVMCRVHAIRGLGARNPFASGT
jgi:hypothetical protein